jgi:hypothetical protein
VATGKTYEGNNFFQGRLDFGLLTVTCWQFLAIFSFQLLRLEAVLQYSLHVKSPQNSASRGVELRSLTSVKQFIPLNSSGYMLQYSLKALSSEPCIHISFTPWRPWTTTKIKCWLPTKFLDFAAMPIPRGNRQPAGGDNLARNSSIFRELHPAPRLQNQVLDF